MHTRTLGMVGTLLVSIALGGALQSVRGQTRPPLRHVVYLPLVQRVPLGGQVVVVQSSIYYETRGAYLVGRVLNTTRSPVYAVTLRARFYDAAGRLLATNTGTTALSATFPGDTTPFSMPVEVPSGARYEVAMTQWEKTADVTYQPLTVVSQRVSRELVTTVSGEVRNDQTRTLDKVQVVVSLPNGFYSMHVLDTVLAPGRSATYSANFIVTGPVGDIRVQAQGVAVP